jgi:hypothetical protein
MALLRSRQHAVGYNFAPNGSGALCSKVGRAKDGGAVTATGRGVRLSDGFDLGIEATSIGRDRARRALGVVEQRAEGQELVLRREDDVEERFLAGPLGLEHSFLVGSRPPGEGPLVIEVAFNGMVPGAVAGRTDRVLLRAANRRAGYRDLLATDGDGRELRARMEVREAVVALVVEDSEARYPVAVDPLWTQQVELTAADGGESASFGYSVAMDDTTAIIGAPGSTLAHLSGAAYIFERQATTWNLQMELAPPDAYFFGAAVAVSGDTLIVGAPWTGDDHTGAAYVFVRNGTTWSMQAKLSGDAGPADQFGSSVGVSGSTAIVGAPASGTLGGGLEAAYIFVRSGTAWTMQAKLAASDGTLGDNFGWSVALSASTAVVGAPAHPYPSGAPLSAPGAVYVFAQSGSAWPQQVELNGMAGDWFGHSVALNAGTLIIGAPGHQVGANVGQGAAYVFAQSGASWNKRAELIAGDGAANDGLGDSVALSGGTAIVSASGHEVRSNAAQGAAYLFSQSGTTWAQQDEVTASDGAPSDHLGPGPGCVAVSGTHAIVGAPEHAVGGNDSQGAAYIFQGPPLAANGTACTADSDCTSNFCVDGVCCDTTCGDGLATDCQSCLGAMTGGADGTCGAVTAAAKYTCRPSTSACDPAGVCDGSSPSCPAAAAPDGGCASSSSSTSSASSSSGAGSFHLTGGCDCRAVPDRGDGRDATRAAWLALGLGLAIGRRRRCRAVRT